MNSIRFITITRVSIFVLILFFVILPTRVSAQCHPSPNFSTMDRDFLDYLNTAANKQPRIAILPFFDNQSGLPDDAIYKGLPFYIYDTFSPNHPNLIHPYLSFNAIQSLGISGEALTQKDQIQKFAAALKARFVIFGSFQLTFRQTIMVHINVFDSKTQSILSPAEVFENPLNDALFDLLNTHISNAMSRIKGGLHLRVSSVRKPSIESFRPYGQGMALAGSYNFAQLQQAEIWLEQALKLSFENYSAAALNLARVQFMLSLIQKLSKQDYPLNYNKALQNLNYVKSDIPANSFLKAITYRYIRGQESSKQALTALIAKQADLALHHAEQGLKLVPEDGMLQNLHLSQSGTKNKLGIKLENPVCY